MVYLCSLPIILHNAVSYIFTATGTVGPTGPRGATGTAGPTGAPGNQGSPGVTGAGIQGIQGVQGIAGVNAYSTTKGFIQPAVGAAVAVQIPSAYWLQQGQYVFLPSGGYYTVASGSVPTFSLQNLGYSGVNIPVGSTVATGFISPGGVAGVTGATGTIGGTGPTGPPGAQGSPGATGATGTIGATGIQGVTGPGVVVSIYGSQYGTGLASGTAANVYCQVPFTATGVFSNTTTSAYTLKVTQAGVIRVVGIVSVSDTTDRVQIQIRQNSTPISISFSTSPGAGGINLVAEAVVMAAINDTFSLYITDSNAGGAWSATINSASLTVTSVSGVAGATGATGPIGGQGSPGATGPGAALSLYGSQIGTGVISVPTMNAFYQVPFTATGISQNVSANSFNLVAKSAGVLEVTGFVTIVNPITGSNPDSVILQLRQNNNAIAINTVGQVGFTSFAGTYTISVQAIITANVNDTFGLWITDTSSNAATITVSASSLLIKSVGGAQGPTGTIGSTGIQGITGATGTIGSTGAYGINAYSTSYGFTQPAVGAAIAINVPSGNWLQVGQYVYIPGGGYYTVASGSVPTFSLQNLGYSGINSPVGSTVSTGFISPGGIAGVTGATGTIGATGIQGITGATGTIGTTGPQGIAGVTGQPGINDYSTTEGFTQPAVGAAIAIQIPSGYWIQQNQIVFIPSAGYYTIASGSVPTFSLQNLGYSGVNIPVGSTVSAAFVSPAGIAGVTGATGTIGSIGPTGPQGATGAYGLNAYSTTAGFTQPAVGAAIAIQIPSGYWIQQNQIVFIPSAGYYQVASGSVPTFSLQNLGYSGTNIPVGSTISAAFVSPGGIAGVTGATGTIGSTGPTGPQGPTGTIGQTGIQGVTGPTGPAGAATSLVNISGDATGVSNNTIIQKLTGFSGYVSVPSGSSLAFGALPGASGAIRLSNNTSINQRNAANTLDFNLLGYNGSNSWFLGDANAVAAATINSGSTLILNSGNNGNLGLVANGLGQLTFQANNILVQLASMLWQFNQSPLISQVAKSSDVATVPFTIQAQNACPSASTNTVGGNLVLMGGSGISTGISNIQVANPLMGYSGPVKMAATLGALSTAANITLTGTQMATPIIQLNGTVKTGNCNITLPNIVGSIWYFDISGVTLGANSMVFTTGSGTSATIGTTQVVTGLNLLTVAVVASNVVSAGGV